MNLSVKCHVTVMCHSFSPSFYLSDGFLHLQNAVGLSIIEYLADKQGLPVPNVTVDMRVGLTAVLLKDMFIT